MTMIFVCILIFENIYASIDCSWNSLTYTWAVRFCGCLQICPCFCLPFCSADTRHLAGGYLSSADIEKEKCSSRAFRFSPKHTVIPGQALALVCCRPVLAEDKQLVLLLRADAGLSPLSTPRFSCSLQELPSLKKSNSLTPTNKLHRQTEGQQSSDTRGVSAWENAFPLPAGKDWALGTQEQLFQVPWDLRTAWCLVLPQSTLDLAPLV